MCAQYLWLKKRPLSVSLGRHLKTHSGERRRKSKDKLQPKPNIPPGSQCVHNIFGSKKRSFSVSLYFQTFSPAAYIACKWQRNFLINPFYRRRIIKQKCCWKIKIKIAKEWKLKKVNCFASSGSEGNPKSCVRNNCFWHKRNKNHFFSLFSCRQLKFLADNKTE